MLRHVVLVAALVPLLAGCLTTSQTLPLPGAGGVVQQVCAITNWADPCTALATTNRSPSQTEIDVAVNPTDPLNVIASSKDQDTLASHCVWAVPSWTKDGGRTWTSVPIGGLLAERQSDPTNPLALWDCITDPILAFDASGTAYYFLQTYHLASDGADCPQTHLLAPVQSPVPVPGPLPRASCGYSFYLAVSTDGGETWPLDRIQPVAIGEGYLIVHDYPRMVVNPQSQSVCAVWNMIGGSGGNPHVACTRDQGQSTDLPALVDYPGTLRSTSFRSGFAAANDGTMYMTVSPRNAVGALPLQDIPTPRPVDLAISTDDGRTWGGFLPMPGVLGIECPLPNTEFRCGTFVELAVDNSGGPLDGALYAVWAGNHTGDADIFLARSDDQGQSWTDPVRVNQDATTNAQWMTRVRVGDDGTVLVVYMDRAFDPEDRLYDATLATSTDGGATWATRRLTSISSDGDLGIHQSGFPFIGDYVGLETVAGHVYAGFPQTVTGKAQLAVAHLMPG